MSAIVTPRRILVPWDFSDMSRRALDWALKLAGDWEATVLVLHVGPSTTAFLSPFPDLAGFQMDAWQQARGRREEQAMERLQDALGAAASLPNVELHYTEADPVAAIEEAVEEEGIGLIVMGTHRREGVARAVLGSVSEVVNRHVDVPVLLVK
jgi:nucleotide-binding universal stress UspA family protein